MRADAQRNRDRIVAAAMRLFEAEGLGVNLDRIAKAAGVGTGTLYRNFPTRESLVAAAYYGEVGWLYDEARELLGRCSAEEALRCWLRRLLAYATSRARLADALLAMITREDHPYADSNTRLCAAITRLLAEGVRVGSVRADVTATDVLAAVTGAALVSAGPTGRAQGERLIDLLVDGLRENRSRADADVRAHALR